MQQENTTVTAAPYAITPKDPFDVSAESQDISGTALINCSGKYLLYIEIVDSSDKKGRCAIAVCHMMKSLSLSLSLISRLFPLFRV